MEKNGLCTSKLFVSASSWFVVVVFVVVMHFICIYFSSVFHFVFLLILFFRFIVRFSWTSMCVILFFPFNCLLHWLICSVFLLYILYFIGNKIAAHQCDQLASISVSYVRDLSFWSQYAMVHDYFFLSDDLILWFAFHSIWNSNALYVCVLFDSLSSQVLAFVLFLSASYHSYVWIRMLHIYYICHISAWSSIHFNVNYWG